MRHVVAYTITLLFIAAVAVFGVAWHYTNVLDAGALRPDLDAPAFDLRIVAVSDATVTLAADGADADDDWRRPGVWGLEWDGGYARVGPILQSEPDEVTRELVRVVGQPAPGRPARIDSYAYPGDPSQALGLLFVQTAIPSDIGDLPAWFLPVSGELEVDTMVIFVHGKDADLRQSLRFLRVLHDDLSLPVLIVSYRNDGIAPDGPDKRYRYGRDEWRDLEAAVRYARGLKVADRFVLFGHSMGGAIIMSFMERSSLAGDVSALILDSPVLDFEAVIDYAADRRDLPGPLTTLAKRLAGLRFDVDWGDLDYLEGADALSVPVLLFHGEDDTKVPIRTSEALLRARPDLVTFVRVAGAEHVASWNADPGAYEQALASFLRRLASPP